VLASWSCSSFPVVALRVELSTTRLSAVSGQPALDYHLPTSSSARSGWQDSNLQSRAPNDHRCAAVPGGLPLPHIPLSFPVRTGGFEPGHRRAAVVVSWPPTRDPQAGAPGTRARYPGFATFCPQ